jgi:hypothetical protein
MLWKERTMSFRMLRGVSLVLLEKRWLVFIGGEGWEVNWFSLM